MSGRKPVIPNPHDRFFRGIMQQQPVIQEFFQAFLPEFIQQHIAFDQIKVSSSSFVEPELSEQINDLLFECQFNIHDQIREGYVYLLVEHQSRPEKQLPLRVFRYVLAALDKHAKQQPNSPLPPIYPMVFYQGERTPYPYSMDFLALFDDPLSLMKQVLFQPVALIDVNQLDISKLQKFPWLHPATNLIQHIRDEDITASLIQLIHECIHLMNHPNGADFLDYLLNYAVEAGNIIDVTEFYHLSKAIPDPVKEKVMTIADMLTKHGWEQGLEQGLEQGALATKRENAINMLKLGSDIEFVCKVTGLSLEEVGQLADTLASKS